MNATITYYIAISDGGSHTYESTTLSGTDMDKGEVIKKAKEWARMVEFPDAAWLQIVANGVGVCTLRPGEF